MQQQTATFTTLISETLYPSSHYRQVINLPSQNLSILVELHKISKKVNTQNSTWLLQLPSHSIPTTTCQISKTELELTEFFTGPVRTDTRSAKLVHTQSESARTTSKTRHERTPEN